MIRKWNRKKQFQNEERGKEQITLPWRIPYNSHRVIKLPTAVNLPLKYKATMNLKGNKKFTKQYTKLKIKKGNSDNKIFWKRDNRREEKNSQILVNNKEAMKSI